MEQIVSFEQKKSILLSYDLKLKEDHAGRVSATYEASKQQGKTVARELVPTGNGYINGKYMRHETIEQNGYVVDERGWISIKPFSEESIRKVIEDAIVSMR